VPTSRVSRLETDLETDVSNLIYRIFRFTIYIYIYQYLYVNTCENQFNFLEQKDWETVNQREFCIHTTVAIISWFVFRMHNDIIQTNPVVFRQNRGMLMLIVRIRNIAISHFQVILRFRETVDIYTYSNITLLFDITPVFIWTKRCTSFIRYAWTVFEKSNKGFRQQYNILYLTMYSQKYLSSRVWMGIVFLF
jgi:hypothetical protein